MRRRAAGVIATIVSSSFGVFAAAADLPADVAAFVEERQQCDHFRGEDPYDKERAAEIDRALDLYCSGTDRRLAGLKAKYSKGPTAVVEVLASFEDNVE